MEKKRSSFQNVSEEFRKRLEKEMGKESHISQEGLITTRSYGTFKKQYLPKHLSFYEQLCRFSEKTLPFKADQKKVPKYQQAISICHLNTTPTGINSAAFLVPLMFIGLMIILFFIMPVLAGVAPNFFFILLSLFLGGGLFLLLQQLPFFLSNSWRMKASNQMVLAIFYVVTYMRHTSNLELAINFAAEHLTPPLSLDLRKVVWDVETQKYDSVKESLDSYLETWRKWNIEFVESMHLIQSSLYETSRERRLITLDKSLTVILDETYEKMLHYAHGLKSPLTTLNMLGIILPILTLVILPLVVNFFSEFRWYYLFAIYNVVLPILVYFLGQNILSTRPGGSGDEDITEKNQHLKQYKNVVVKFAKSKLFFSPAYLAVLTAIVLLLIGLFPLIWHGMAPQSDFALIEDGARQLRIGNTAFMNVDDTVRYYFLGFRERLDDGAPTGQFIGPFGLGALLLSICIPLSIGYSIGLYYKLRSKNIIKVRRQSKALELEFSSALFQLGSRIGDGIPAELAFGKVSEVMQDTTSGKFFTLVNVNITRLGMSVEQAIFDREKGALQYYPSDLIESSMKVLVESSKKGPQVASQALLNVSEYIKQMHRVDERLKDLMGDVISSMKSQVRFLTPVISAIVVGITSMITKILGSLVEKLGDIGAQTGNEVAGSSLLAMFGGSGIPTYFFQIVVGLYVVQLAYILTVIGNGIENGPDKIAREYELGQNMTKSILLYSVLTFIIIILFNVVAGGIMSNLNV